MWHMDGVHKIIHWRFTISEVADGNSRMIFWLKISNNSESVTVFNYFLNAVEEFQCPFQIRGDICGENQLVAKYMTMVKVTKIRGFIGGDSTKNIRI